MSKWEDFKEWTKQAALSKPMRWLVSGITGLTFGSTLLSWLIKFLPVTTPIILAEVIITLICVVSVARATSRGYTAIEEYIKKVDQQNLLLVALKKEVRTLKNIVDANHKMTVQLVEDDKTQNENNKNAYLQQMGVIRFCERISEHFPDEERDKLLNLLQPPSLNQVQGKNAPYLLASTLIQPEMDSDPDSADELLERKTDIPTNDSHESKDAPTNTGLLGNIYEGAKSVSSMVYGTFWSNTRNINAVELSRQQNREALLAGLPRDNYDIENPPQRQLSGSSNDSGDFSPAGSPPALTNARRF